MLFCRLMWVGTVHRVDHLISRISVQMPSAYVAIRRIKMKSVNSISKPNVIYHCGFQVEIVVKIHFLS